MIGDLAGLKDERRRQLADRFLLLAVIDQELLRPDRGGCLGSA